MGSPCLGILVGEGLAGSSSRQPASMSSSQQMQYSMNGEDKGDSWGAARLSLTVVSWPGLGFIFDFPIQVVKLTGT